MDQNTVWINERASQFSEVYGELFGGSERHHLYTIFERRYRLLKDVHRTCTTPTTSSTTIEKPWYQAQAKEM